MRIVSFLRKRAEKIISSKILELMGLIEECNSILHLILKKALTDGEMENLHDKIHMAEHGADILRRTILDEIQRSAFQPERKMVLTNLVKSLDVIADWHLSVSRVVRSITASSKLTKLPEDFKNLIFKAMDTNTKGVKGVTKALEALFKGDLDAALDATDEVERLEELVDSYFGELTAIIYTGKIRESGCPELGVYMLAEALENIADACENACDEVRVAVVSFTKER